MEKNVQIFNNPHFGKIRVVINQNNEPIFCLADLCNVIGIANPRNVKTRLEEEDVCQMDTPTTSGIQSITFVTESGMYDVIIRSDSEKAKPFRKWVTSEVLPSIRKRGAYITPQKIEEALLNPDILIQLATNLKEEQQKRISAENQIEVQKPKVLFADAIIASDTSVLIGRLANVLKQNGVDIGQNRLFKWMRDNGYLCKFGERYNQPTQYSMDLGLFEVTYNTVVRPETSFQTITTKVTGKGQIYFVEKFLTPKSA